ncbi:hypothetical protein Pmani_023540 [Petrolisthes manimaculis]|uniref:PDEase domain-containing protein n=1 Tax=Petrolisthes manimaculis TaxID=1843537 RepID=A0AAE1PBR9_9EUCA|nr:hypothetical protein Pmani_023540 [Petrolisthes manimaculis]
MLILATDMARHSEIVDDFKNKLDNFDYGNVNHLNVLKMILIKACDISNEVRPNTVAEPWVDCLLEEYFNQAETEKQEGLPVAPFMDREKVTKSSAQIGFIKFVLIPLFESICQLFPQAEERLVAPLRQAREHYEELKEKEEEIRRISQGGRSGVINEGGRGGGGDGGHRSRSPSSGRSEETERHANKSSAATNPSQRWTSRPMIL